MFKPRRCFKCFKKGSTLASAQKRSTLNHDVYVAPKRDRSAKNAQIDFTV